MRLTDGILSVPEINVARGGIKYTTGPDFSAIYSGVGFCQTEAQAIAGTTKPCYEVPCPPFVEVRLDACGICIKVPILTNAAYPELVSATLSERADRPPARDERQGASPRSLPRSVLRSRSRVSVPLRPTPWKPCSWPRRTSAQKYRLPLSSSLEVVVPFWAKDVLLSDVARRTG